MNEDRKGLIFFLVLIGCIIFGNAYSLVTESTGHQELPTRDEVLASTTKSVEYVAENPGDFYQVCGTVVRWEDPGYQGSPLYLYVDSDSDSRYRLEVVVNAEIRDALKSSFADDMLDKNVVVDGYVELNDSEQPQIIIEDEWGIMYVDDYLDSLDYRYLDDTQ